MQLVGKLTTPSKLKGTLTSNGSLIGELNKPIYVEELYREIDTLRTLFATKDYVVDYVSQYGGNVNTISVNGIPQYIDENKHVDLTIPIYTAGNGLTLSNDNVFALDELIIDCGTSIRVI